MGLHVDKNGVGSVTPNYLYHPNGHVPDPSQRAGTIPYLHHSPLTGMTQGHPWFGGNKSAVVIGETK